MVKKYRIAVWGIGNHARKTVLPAISDCNFLSLTGIGSRNRQVGEQQASYYNCCFWESLDALLDDMDVDVVYLSTPIGLHYQEALRVLESGRHLWCEKSLTTSYGKAEEMAELAKARDLSLCVVCGPIFHPQFLTLQKLLRDGAIGKVETLTGVFEFPHLNENDSRYNADLGGSALLDLGFYPVVVLNELVLGECQVQSASRASDPGYAVDTGGDAILVKKSGALLKTQWAYGRDYRNEISIRGTHGSLYVSPAFSRPQGRDLSIRMVTGDTVTMIPVEAENQFVNMMAVFSRAIEDREERTRLRDWTLNSQLLLEDVSKKAAESG